MAAGGSKPKGELAERLAEAGETLKQVLSECPSFEAVVPAMLEHGVMKLPEVCGFSAGVPVKPMLAKPTTGVGEVLKRFDGIEFTCEYKYDGERAQVHVLDDGTVKVFSRNSEDNTSRFPDIVGAMPGYLKPGIKSIVLDCEAVAFDRAEQKILPFQVLSTRGRKDIKVEDIKVNVCLYAFDCLYVNGDVLLREPLSTRRKRMYDAIAEKPGEMLYATYKTSRDVEELQTFLDDSIQANTEGLIVKTMDATYEPSKRSLNWLKLKKDYLEGIGDTVDLVPIGAWYGRGKRTGVYGAYLLACYDPESEDFQTVCKIGTGFSDEDLKVHAEKLAESAVDGPRPFYRYGDGPNVTPDVWFQPTQVWEVKAADLSISPVHKGAVGLVDPTKGIALRFPRFMRVREDKPPEQATSPEQLAEMYNSQAINHGYVAAEDDE